MAPDLQQRDQCLELSRSARLRRAGLANQQPLPAWPAPSLISAKWCILSILTATARFRAGFRARRRGHAPSRSLGPTRKTSPNIGKNWTAGALWAAYLLSSRVSSAGFWNHDLPVFMTNLIEGSIDVDDQRLLLLSFLLLIALPYLYAFGPATRRTTVTALLKKLEGRTGDLWRVAALDRSRGPPDNRIEAIFESCSPPLGINSSGGCALLGMRG